MHLRSSSLFLSACSLCICACLRPPELGEQALPETGDSGSEAGSWGAFADLPSPPGDTDTGADTGAPPEDESTGESGAGGAANSDAGAPENPHLAQLRLSEIHADPEGKDGDLDSPEFIEIKNIGPEPVFMEGFELEAQSWPRVTPELLAVSGEVLGPDAHLLVRRWTKEQPESLIQAQWQGSTLMTGLLHNDGLRNSQGLVQLRSSSGEVIDEFVYGEGGDSEASIWQGPPSAAPPAGLSQCRLDFDELAAEAWSSCIPSPGQMLEDTPEPTLIPPGSLVITEVWADPPGPASDEKVNEYVEITNVSDVELELIGCTIGDALEADAPGIDPLEHYSGDGGCESLTCLAPGRRALIVGNTFAPIDDDVLILSTDDSTIADGGLTTTEPVVLRDQQGEVASTYRAWPDPSAAPLPSDELPLHRIELHAEDLPRAWIVAAPSPGS